MGKLLLPFLALFTFLILLPHPGEAQGEIAVIQSTMEVDFPKTITFGLEAEGQEEISKVVLQYRVERRSCVPVTSTAFPDLEPASHVETRWTWDLKKTGGLPPGAKIQYWWVIEDEAGHNLETPSQRETFRDHRYNWQSLVQEGVTLLWYRGDQSFAQALMDSALEALEKLAQDTGISLEEPVSLYIYEGSQAVRGAMIYPQEWTGGVSFVNYGIVLLGISPGSLTWGKRATAHELAHLVVYQRTFNCYGGDLPTWLEEGLAMYAEGNLSAENRSLLEEAIAGDELISVRTLSSSFPAHAGEALLSYAESHSLIDFLVRGYGSQKMLQLLDVFKGGSGYDQALERVYGFDMDGLDDRWRASLGLHPREELTPAPEAQPSPTSQPTLTLTPTPEVGPFGCGASFQINQKALRGEGGFNTSAVAGVVALLPGVGIILRRLFKRDR